MSPRPSCSSAIRTTNTRIAYCASLPEQLGVCHADVLAVRGDRVADEAREVRAEGEDQQRDDHLRHEQHDAAEQVGDVGEPEAVEGDHQRGEQHQPVDEQTEHVVGVRFAAALLQEAVDARVLGERR